MTNMPPFASAFASPHGGEAHAVVRALALARLNSTRRRIAAAVENRGLAETGQALLAGAAGQASAWRPETGLALQRMLSQPSPDSSTLQMAALQLAASCASMGGSGCLEARVEGPQRLYLDGWLVPVSGCWNLAADGRSIRINADLGEAAFLASDHNRWSPADPLPGPWTAYASGGLAPRYVTASGLRWSVESFPWISDPPPLNAVDRPGGPDARITAIHEAWRKILEFSPVYSAWVASTAAGCLLLDPSGKGTAQFGSSYDYPGLIAIEPSDSPIFSSEILVHECSHQHLLVFGMVAQLVTPDSDEMSYSLIKRAYRTMDRVLTGGHAVGNMIIYYASLRRKMELHTASRKRFDQYCTWFADDYRPALNQSKSLTEAGRTLWSSLCRAVDSAREN
jgi:HEXXH motif-containing protein